MITICPTCKKNAINKDGEYKTDKVIVKRWGEETVGSKRMYLLKAEEKPERTSVMDGLSRSQAALIAAQKISKKAVKVGFEWPNEDSLYNCLYSEINEFKEAEKEQDKTHKEEELGDILFAVVNLARWNKIDAEQALLKANKKFEKRFRKMEELATKPLTQYSFDEYDALWEQAKKALQKPE